MTRWKIFVENDAGGRGRELWEKLGRGEMLCFFSFEVAARPERERGGFGADLACFLAVAFHVPTHARPPS